MTTMFQVCNYMSINIFLPLIQTNLTMKLQAWSIISLFIHHLINCLIHQYIRMSFSCFVKDRPWYCELIKPNIQSVVVEKLNTHL